MSFGSEDAREPRNSEGEFSHLPIQTFRHIKSGQRIDSIGLRSIRI